MSDTIKVLKEILEKFDNCGSKMLTPQSAREQQAIKEALLGLEKLEAISLWVERDSTAQEKYRNIRSIIKGEINLEYIKEFLNKSKRVKNK